MSSVSKNTGRFKGKATLTKELLEKLQFELAKSKGSRVRLGVLAGHKVERDPEQTGTFSESGYQAKTEEPLNNADIGAVHELGSKSGNIPQRSFLRLPIQSKLPEEVKKIKAVKIVKMILTKGMEFSLRTLGVIGEQVVDKGFESRGYGQWKPNAESTIQQKGSDMPLIDRALLRKSITSKVYMANK